MHLCTHAPMCRKRIKAEKAAKDTRGRSTAVAAAKQKQQGSDDEGEGSGDEGTKEGGDAPAAVVSTIRF